MTPTTLLTRQWPLATGYALLAGAAVGLTRFDGGVAFIWGASALLIATLVQTSLRNWWAPLAVCAGVGVLITGLVGLGWKASPVLLIANLGEAILAAYWLKQKPSAGELMASLPWFGRFVTAMIGGPLLTSPFAALAVWMAGGDPLGAMKVFAFGHALGNLALTPIAYMLTGRAARRETQRILARRKRAALLILPAVGAVCLLTFGQSKWPLLFLPVMLVVFATFRLGRLGAAICLAILTTIGGIMTALDLGPISLSAAPVSERMQFFQLYLAATVLTVLPIAADLHSRRKLHRNLRRSEAEFRMLAEHCTDVIMRIAPDGTIRYASPSIEKLTGYCPPLLVGRHSSLLIDPRDLDETRVRHRATLAAKGEARTYGYRCTTRTGEVRWFSTHGRALLDDEGRPHELLAIIRDITDAKEEQEHWQSAALTDRLTGLANRRALEAAIAALKPGEHCLALLDLDRFKAINDTYGHDCGDAVLRGFADIASRLVRSHDTLARLGGEEFVILFEHTTIDQAYEVCDRLRRIVGQTPLATPAGTLRMTVSGGVSNVKRSGLDASLKAADEALYRAKKSGRDRLLLAA